MGSEPGSAAFFAGGDAKGSLLAVDCDLGSAEAGGVLHNRHRPVGC